MTTLSLFTNRATAKLAADAVSGDTALTLVPGGGAWFPAPAANQFFRLVLQKGSGQTDQREYMVCTGRTGDVLTVTRAQEGTPAANFTAGDEVSLVITAITASSFAQKLGIVLQGALEVEADPTSALGIATKQFVENGRLADAPSDTKDYARRDAAWHALGAAAGLAIPIPVNAGGTGGTTLAAAQTNLVIGLTTIDDLAPATPKYGDRWIRPGNMSEMVWVPNAGGGGAGAWINPADASSEAYPIAVTKGGTGATDAATARLNLGLDNATGQRVLGDGTVAAPSLAFASEATLGWYREAAGKISMASAGAKMVALDLSAALTPSLTVYPRTADGNATFTLNAQPVGASIRQYVALAASKTVASLTSGDTTSGPNGVLPFVINSLNVTSYDAWAIHASVQDSVNLTLDKKAAAGSTCNLVGQSSARNRWLVQLGDGNAESGSDAGSNFSIYRHNDAGTLNSTPVFSLTRANALASFAGSVNITGSITLGGNITGQSFIGTPGQAVGWTGFVTTAGPAYYQMLSYGDPNTGQAFFIRNIHNAGVWFGIELAVGSNSFSMRNNGNAYAPGSWVPASDARLKSNLTPVTGALEALLQLRAYEYDREDLTEIDGSHPRHIGLLAQDVQKVLRRAVDQAAATKADPEPMRYLNYNAITAVLVSAMETINARLAALEAA